MKFRQSVNGTQHQQPASTLLADQERPPVSERMRHPIETNLRASSRRQRRIAPEQTRNKRQGKRPQNARETIENQYVSTSKEERSYHEQNI
jgi:hypothetical protein